MFFGMFMALLATALIGIAIATPIVAFMALTRVNGLERQVALLRRELAARTAPGAGSAPPEPETPPESETPPEPAPERPAPSVPEAPAAEAAPEAARPRPARAAVQAETPPPPSGPSVPEAPPPPQPPGPARGDFEQQLASRWILWLGGVALALGGGFLVKYSIDQGWIGPPVRVALGVLLGLGLAVLGEWFRRRPLQRAIAAVTPNYLPPALSSAGVAITFASVYAAYGLYALIPPLLAFVGLAVVAAGAIALSLLHGPFLAGLGLVGAFVAPALVSTREADALTLFSYLLFVEAAAFGLVRYRAWGWLGWTGLVGAAAWIFLWVISQPEMSERPILAGFAVLLLPLIWVGTESYVVEPARRAPRLLALAGTAVVAFFVLWISVLVEQDYGMPWLAAVAAAGMIAIAAGRRALLPAGFIAAAMLLLILLSWAVPLPMPRPEGPFDRAFDLAPLTPTSVAEFLAWAGAYAALVAVSGFALAWRGEAGRGAFAALSAAMPVLTLVVAYRRLERMDLDLEWALTATGIAMLMVLAAERILHRAPDDTGRRGAGAYAAASVAALSLAMVFILENAWLTVALSLQLPVLAWIERRLDLPVLRQVAFVVAGIVLIRLVLNPYIFEYPIGTVPIFNWLLYGYGIPAVAFAVAGAWFRMKRRDGVSNLIQGGAVAFITLLVTYEIRHWVTDGDLDAPIAGFLEMSLQIAAWLTMALGYYYRSNGDKGSVTFWASAVLGGVATFALVTGSVVYRNPTATGDPVGTWPVIDTLLIAYAYPALLALLFYRWARRPEHEGAAKAAAVAALVLIFIYASFEVRHWYQGEVLRGATSDAEWYTYSLVWLVYALGLLALGLWRNVRSLRFASLAVLAIVIVKAFGSDMAALTGLYRVLSFIGLGASLIGIGYLYQRFVFRPGPAEPAPAQD